MAYQNLITSDRGSVRVLTINRPSALNALNSKTIEELRNAFSDAEENSAVRVVILTGAGEKSFVAGADIHEMQGLSPEGARKFAEKGQRLMSQIENGRKPVIASVNGFALGGGLELALACDFIYASENARFGLVETKLGLVPGFGGNKRLMRVVNKPVASEMIYSALQIDARRAFDIGLVNQCFSKEALGEQTLLAAGRIAEQSPYANGLVKGLLNESHDMPMEVSQKMEQKSFALCFSHPDHEIGITAFSEKRAPKFA